MTNLMEALAEAKRSIDFPRHAALHAASEAEITRLRAENARLTARTLAPASGLFDEAADEIERLNWLLKKHQDEIGALEDEVWTNFMKQADR
jgi:hypothetical protein